MFHQSGLNMYFTRYTCSLSKATFGARTKTSLHKSHSATHSGRMHQMVVDRVDPMIYDAIAKLPKSAAYSSLSPEAREGEIVHHDEVA